MGMRLRSAAHVFESSSARVRRSPERALITAGIPNEARAACSHSFVIGVDIFRDRFLLCRCTSDSNVTIAFGVPFLLLRKTPPSESTSSTVRRVMELIEVDPRLTLWPRQCVAISRFTMRSSCL
jgi:hypothetical protein